MSGEDDGEDEECQPVKVLLVLSAVGAGVVWWRRRRAVAAEDALWAEAGAAAGRDLR